MKELHDRDFLMTDCRGESFSQLTGTRRGYEALETAGLDVRADTLFKWLSDPEYNVRCGYRDLIHTAYENVAIVPADPIPDHITEGRYEISGVVMTGNDERTRGTRDAAPLRIDRTRGNWEEVLSPTPPSTSSAPSSPTPAPVYTTPAPAGAMAHLDRPTGVGLRRCIDEMLTANTPKRCLTILGVEDYQAEPPDGTASAPGGSPASALAAALEHQPVAIGVCQDDFLGPSAIAPKGIGIVGGLQRDPQ
ncbi:hypothetical protein [Streptomyces sp. SAS_276]|uniref:hypothetical protein n=1 Tax=Streptomyces sp. SAS_276 TaxID=3412745 RepID=UPI00403C0FFA